MKMEISGGIPYSHTPNKQGQWKCLDAHLREVAELARQFANAFGQGDLAYLIGLAHDLGKLLRAFQRYLLAIAHSEQSEKVPHAWVGAAVFAQRRRNILWEGICLPIAGHHSGLGERGLVSSRLSDKIRGNQEFLAGVQATLVDMLRTTAGEFGSEIKIDGKRSDQLKRELNTRMLFSCLVDADRLAAEAHRTPENRPLRSKWPEVQTLWARFKADQARLMATADNNKLVNAIRNEVYQHCLTAAALKPGFFRLTVPTGGGKTRSSLAFAVKHCLDHGLRRVVIGLPYTSIIDQTAQTCREIFGQSAVLEHHSQIDDEVLRQGQDDTEGEIVGKQELASENWDAPLIVTTTVQLFESLFSNLPSKCRKVHNLAGSVIILDEVQTFPPELLSPTLDLLRDLVEDYRVSVVFCTATQPALKSTPFLKALSGVNIHEIVPQYERHFHMLKRVNYELRELPVTKAELAGELQRKEQVLAVLNSRKDALAVVSMLPESDHAFHLSALLCPYHRRDVLREVNRRLETKSPVCLVSTQVIEAGVNIDFPQVYRALGPLDRIVQAAGRCNREGKPDLGKVVIFELQGERIPRGAYTSGLEKARLLLHTYPHRLDDPTLYEEYFKRLYHDLDLDVYAIQEYREALDYPAVAALYKLIPTQTVPVVVPYKDAFSHLSAWLKHPTRDIWRRLQQYIVTLYRYELESLKGNGLVDEVTNGLYRWMGEYDWIKGVQAIHDPSDPML